MRHREFFIRANTRSGNAENFWVDEGVDVHWVTHESDPSVDVAVLVWAPPPELDFLCVPSIMFLDDDGIVRKRIGIGDEVHVTGLFSFHRGETRIEPIVRSGHVAMMPKERVPVPKWHPDGIDGYLIEGRSIGGFSGSPVFVMRSIEVQPTEETGRRPLATGAAFLLGLMHGHWDFQPEDADAVQIGDEKPDPERKINSGVSIVVPCSKILEVLRHPAIRDAGYRATGARNLEEAGVDVSNLPGTMTISIVTSVGPRYKVFDPAELPEAAKKLLS